MLTTTNFLFGYQSSSLLRGSTLSFEPLGLPPNQTKLSPRCFGSRDISGYKGWLFPSIQQISLLCVELVMCVAFRLSSLAGGWFAYSAILTNNTSCKRDIQWIVTHHSLLFLGLQAQVPSREVSLTVQKSEGQSINCLFQRTLASGNSIADLLEMSSI